MFKLNIQLFFLCMLIVGCNNEKSILTYTPNASSENISDLFGVIKTLDSLFFDVAYNKCDSSSGRKLISKDFEFYHDKSGYLSDEPNELASDIMAEDLSWICNNTFRKLVIDKMEVYPLYEDNKLYGAIQTGNHQFYNVENSVPTELDVNAKFIHLWIIEENEWKLKRVFSFDHQKVNNNH